MIRKFLSIAVLGIVFIGLSLPAAQSATISNNSKCLTLGATTKSQGYVFKCELKNTGFFWVRQPAKKVPIEVISATWFKSFSKHGLLTESCQSDGLINLQLIDPISGKITAEHSLKSTLPDSRLGSLHINLCNSSLNQDATSNLYLRQQFSSDFSKLVFTSDAQSDGSVHAGYIDLASSKVFDITALTKTTGFSAIVSVDYSPIFNPIDGDFCFLRTGATADSFGGGTGNSDLHCSDLNSKVDSILGNIPSSNSSDISDEFLTSQHGIMVSGDLLVSPDSSTYAFSNSLFGGQVNFAASSPFVSSSSADPFNDQGNSTILNDPFGTRTTTLDGWISDNLLLVELSGFSGIYTVPSSAANLMSADPHDLIPTNSAINTNVVLSPDGTQLAFVHTLVNQSDLYTSLASGVGLPVKVKTNFNLHIIGWQ